jgi:hypothetical protein
MQTANERRMHSMTESSSPDKVLDTKDPGGDTARRYRYQAACTALLSLELLPPESEFEEILCEQFEDFILKRKDGHFIGYQVKTKKLEFGPFSLDDKSIVKAIDKFIKIEDQFPGKFTNFIIGSNCGFSNEEPQSVNNLGKLIQEVNNDSMKTGSKKWVKQFTDSSKKTTDLTLAVIKKMRLQQMPDLDRYEDTLTSRVAAIIGHQYDYGIACSKARMLIDNMFRQSAIPCDYTKIYYFQFHKDPAACLARSIIEDKRVTKEKVENIVNNKLPATIPLRHFEGVDLSQLPKGIRKLELKLAKGGLSSGNIYNAKNQKFSADVLVARWISRYSENDQAGINYEDISSIVLNVCLEAYDKLLTENKPVFGTEMLNQVRERLQKKYDEDLHNLYPECKYEHLLGFAMSLTEQCLVWWSEIFPIPEEPTI